MHCQDLEKKWQYASVRVQSKIISRANHHRDFPGTLWVGPSIAHRMQTPGALNNSKPWERKPRQEKLRICYSFEVSWLSLIPRLFRTNSSFVILFLMPPVDWRDMLLPCQSILRKGLDCEDRSEAWWERRRAPVSRAQSASTCDDKVSDYGGQKQTKRINKQYSNACICLCLHQILSRSFPLQAWHECAVRVGKTVRIVIAVLLGKLLHHAVDFLSPKNFQTRYVQHDGWKKWKFINMTSGIWLNLISSICLDCTKEPRQAGERRTGNVARSHPGTGNIRCAANYSPITIQTCLGSAWPLKSNPPTKACSAFLLKGLSSCRNKCTSPVQVWHSLLDRRWSWTHNFLAQVVANGRFVEALLQQRQQSTSSHEYGLFWVEYPGHFRSSNSKLIKC